MIQMLPMEVNPHEPNVLARKNLKLIPMQTKIKILLLMAKTIRIIKMAKTKRMW